MIFQIKMKNEGLMKLGVIGGSGLYEIDGLTDISTKNITTPFGSPSDSFICGKLAGIDAVFLPRHGKGHRICPGELNHRANIWAMKSLGVTHILSISAVGSLREELRPRDVVLVDQYFDRTKNASGHSFFGNGIVGHVAFAEPVCPELKQLAHDSAVKSVSLTGLKDKVRVHFDGTYVNMEGPAFSTKAESRFYKSSGFDVIGMTNLPEAKLSREAEICYSTVAMVTDYDCWHPEHDHVTVEMIIANLGANASLAKEIVKQVADSLNSLTRKCPCPSALATAIVTARDMIPKETLCNLKPIIAKYINCPE